MLEPGGRANLAEEPLGAEAGGELGMKHLERDGAVVLQVAGEINRGHAAPAKLALQDIASAKSVG